MFMIPANRFRLARTQALAINPMRSAIVAALKGSSVNFPTCPRAIRGGKSRRSWTGLPVMPHSKNGI
jgi:hypothetical protein